MVDSNGLVGRRLQIHLQGLKLKLKTAVKIVIPQPLQANTCISLVLLKEIKIFKVFLHSKI